ncbi:LuxR C-terminal-related transcriptional regulator [Actinosynnema sp. NPDC059335]|uniref:helix-turn-helix transcriptional regulator n=1 Tax=Actinosynnema sp. NPDC059335 TaxID=3346804 RepID=UPI00366C39F4
MSKLYGRDREWASVLRFLSAPGGLLAIDGPPCSGKTSLLRDAVAAARDRGYAVVLVAGDHLTDVPDRVPDGPRPLVAIDQAHHDPAALLALLPRLAERRVTTLLALSSAPADAHVRCAVTVCGEVLRLGPLDDDAVERMVADLVGAAPHPELVSLVAGAGGDPGLVADLVAGLVDEGRVEVRDGVARPRGGWPPRRVGTAVAGRVGALSPRAAQVLRVAAVVGRSFRLRDVAVMMDETTGSLLPAVDEVLASGLVVAVEERLEFASHLVWRAVVDSMPGAVRNALRHDAEVLRVVPAEADWVVGPGVAEPGAGVGEATEDGVVEGGVAESGVVEGEATEGGVAESGVAESGVVAPGAGVGGVAGAEVVEGGGASGVGGDDPGDAAVRAVRSLAVSGTLGSAIALARESLARGVPAGAAAELHVVLAGILLADGRPADAASEMEHVLTTPSVPPPLRRLAEAGRLLSLYFATGSRARAHALSVLTTRDREPGDADVVMAATVHSCLEWSAGKLAEGMYWGRESTRWELDRPTAWWQSQSAVSFALKLSALGEFEQAERLVRDDVSSDDAAVRAGAPTARTIALARVLVQAGKVNRALAAARRGLSTARDRGLRILVPLASTVLATVALHRGEVAAAAEHVRRYRADLAAGEAVLHSGQYDWVELLLAHAQHGPERAAELARERMADLDGARRMLIEEPGAAPWLVRQATAVDDRELGREVVGAVERLAADNPGFAVVAVGAGHARALLERDAVGLADAARRHRHPWARANAYADLAAVVGEEGDAERAAVHTGFASRIFEQMGAEGELARLRGDEAGGAGGGEEWRLLSGAERDIALLVGAGMTNRQVAKQLYLSPHTVNYHLRGIFRKLGISSRVELARVAHSQEGVEVSPG